MPHEEERMAAHTDALEQLLPVLALTARIDRINAAATAGFMLYAPSTG
jgi:hypothetical protein